MLLPDLQSLGLSHSEAEVYELLLRLGEVPLSALQSETKLKRPTLYKTLYSLKAKKLVTTRDLHKKLHFRPAPPTELLALAENTYRTIETTQKNIRAVLPELVSSYTLAVEQPIVTTYEGVEGLKKIYNDQVAQGQPIYAFLNTAVVDPQLFTWLTKVHVKERARAQVPAKVIVSSGQWMDEYMKQNEKELRETRVVPSIHFPFQHEVDIYGDKVAFVHYAKDEPLIGIVIDHPKIARTMKAVFDLAWLGAESTQLHSLPHVEHSTSQ